MLSGTAAQLIRSIDAFPVHRLVGGIFLLSLEKCFCTIPMGSTEAYNLSCATDILSNHPCPEACELFYNGIEWKCYPDDTELNDVIAHPEQYIVIPVLFSDK